MSNPVDLFSLDGKVALVTGAGSGLGRQFSEVMAEAGADVGCADIDAESARAAAAAVEGLGRRGVAIGCDVTVEAEVEAMEAAWLSNWPAISSQRDSRAAGIPGDPIRRQQVTIAR